MERNKTYKQLIGFYKECTIISDEAKDYLINDLLRKLRGIE